MNQLTPSTSPNLPALLTTAEAQTQIQFWEFFAAQIRNQNTRRAYGHATGQFLFWCEKAGVSSIAGVKPLHVAAYIEQLGRDRSAPAPVHRPRRPARRGVAARGAAFRPRDRCCGN